MVQFECPRHLILSASSNFGVGRFPFSQYQPSGVIRIGSPVWRIKSWKNLRVKWAVHAVNDPFWMPKALKPFLSSNFYVNRRILKLIWYKFESKFREKINKFLRHCPISNSHLIFFRSFVKWCNMIPFVTNLNKLEAWRFLKKNTLTPRDSSREG